MEKMVQKKLVNYSEQTYLYIQVLVAFCEDIFWEAA